MVRQGERASSAVNRHVSWFVFEFVNLFFQYTEKGRCDAIQLTSNVRGHKLRGTRGQDSEHAVTGGNEDGQITQATSHMSESLLVCVFLRT